MTGTAGTGEAGGAPGGAPGGAAAGMAGKMAGTNGAAAEQLPEWAAPLPDDAKGLVQTKGWKTPADPIKGYAELERMLGADKAGRGLVLPKDEADAAGWDAVYSKLGRPEKPQAYDLGKVEGVVPEVAERMAAEMHKAGLSKKQAEHLATAWMGLSKEMGDRAAAAKQTQVAEQTGREFDEVRRSWGPEFDARYDLATRFALSFIGAVPVLKEDLTLANGDVIKAGSPDPRSEQFRDMAALEEAWGTKKFLARMYEMGRRMGELRTPAPGAGGGTNPATREGALAEIGRLSRDQEFQKRVAAKDAAAVEQWNGLYKIAYPGTNQAPG